MNSIIKLDTREPLTIPNELRENLKLEERAEVLLSVDVKINTITISPIYGKSYNLVKMEIEFIDAQGALVKIVKNIGDITIELIMAESKKSQAEKKVCWYILTAISKCKYQINQTKQLLLKSNFVESMSITKIARDRLHR
jgi:hypothetical protein